MALLTYAAGIAFTIWGVFSGDALLIAIAFGIIVLTAASQYLDNRSRS